MFHYLLKEKTSVQKARDDLRNKIKYLSKEYKSFYVHIPNSGNYLLYRKRMFYSLSYRKGLNVLKSGYHVVKCLEDFPHIETELKKREIKRKAFLKHLEDRAKDMGY